VSEAPTASVRVQQVGHASHEAFEEAVGTVQARWRSVVEAKVSGRIEKMPVITGQRVEEGDLLVQLDAREIQARLDQATAVREQADADLQRFSTLLRQEAVTRAEYDAVQARQRVAQAAVTEAETQLAHTRVIAPFAGAITRKHADVGDLAAPGRPLLELEDPTQLQLEANVPEALITRIQPGNRLRVRIDALNQPLDGVVTEVAPSADPNSRTFLAKIDLPSHDDLRAGQFGRVAIPVGQFAALRVPASAVVKRGQLEIVFVAQDGKAQLRLVKTGKLLENEIEILSGIDSNEVVIVDGLTTLLDGQPVKIVE
jgi:RND family efflux transporter MFP subunit